MDNRINVRVRMVIIKNGKLLVQHRHNPEYYYYVGGHIEYGETIIEACNREIAEECMKAKFEFKKILYIRDLILSEYNEHSVELFILGDINKFEELEHHLDPEHKDGKVWCTWLDVNKLPDNLLPHQMSGIFLKDYKLNFPNEGQYLGRMD